MNEMWYVDVFKGVKLFLNIGKIFFVYLVEL